MNGLEKLAMMKKSYYYILALINSKLSYPNIWLSKADYSYPANNTPKQVKGMEIRSQCPERLISKIQNLPNLQYYFSKREVINNNNIIWDMLYDSLSFNDLFAWR